MLGRSIVTWNLHIFASLLQTYCRNVFAAGGSLFCLCQCSLWWSSKQLTLTQKIWIKFVFKRCLLLWQCRNRHSSLRHLWTYISLASYLFPCKMCSSNRSSISFFRSHLQSVMIHNSLRSLSGCALRVYSRASNSVRLHSTVTQSAAVLTVNMLTCPKMTMLTCWRLVGTMFTMF